MAIVVEVGGGQNPWAAGIGAALKGAGDYARGKMDAEKEREEKERREAEDLRAQEAHDARMAEAELDLERGQTERERDNARWERQAGEGGTWDQADEDRAWELERRAVEEGREDILWTEGREDRARGITESAEDRALRLSREQQKHDFWVRDRGYEAESQGQQRITWARTNRHLDRIEKIAEQDLAAEPGEAAAYLRSLKISPLSSRYEDADWERITKQIEVGGLRAGRKEVQQLNNIIRSQMDDEAAAKLQTDPTNVTTGGLDQALNAELIDAEEYQEAQESLAAWKNMTPEERAQARKSGAFRSPDSMLVGLHSRKRAKRKMKARAKEWGESFVAAEALYDATMTALMEDEDFDLAEDLEKDQREALQEARELLGELEEAAESGVPGTDNPRALVGKIRRALMAAKPLNEEQRKKAEAAAKELDEANAEVRRLRVELKAAKAAAPAPAPAPAPTADHGTRVDGTPKGGGWKGEIEMTDGSGRVMTELSMTVGASDVGTTGDDVLIPTIVPTLTKAEIDHLAGGGEPGETIMRKAVAHAKARLKKGESVWKEDAAPAATPAPAPEPEPAPTPAESHRARFLTNAGEAPHPPRRIYMRTVWEKAKPEVQEAFEPTRRADYVNKDNAEGYNQYVSDGVAVLKKYGKHLELPSALESGPYSKDDVKLVRGLLHDLRREIKAVEEEQARWADIRRQTRDWADVAAGRGPQGA